VYKKIERSPNIDTFGVVFNLNQVPNHNVGIKEKLKPQQLKD
jgi:hypothetical protein